MPTSKPRVTAYPNLSLYRKLEKFQKAKGLKTLSKAIVTALEDYFSLMEIESTTTRKQTLSFFKREIEEMQSRLNELSRKVEDLESEIEKEKE